jgi:dolichyl-phosphate beta-glucosyltransferase
MAKKLSIIVPAYNEGRMLEAASIEILKSFPHVELIICNDGSSDNTSTINIKLGSKIKYIESGINKGKGFSIRKGMFAATGDYVIFTDADLPFGVEGIQKILAALDSGKADVVIAEKTGYRRSVLYLVARKLMRWTLCLLFRFPYHDTQAGLKGFTRQAKDDIFRHSVINGFAIDVEILMIAKIKLMRIESINLAVRKNEFRKSHFKLKSGLRFLSDIIKIRGLYWR